jgi:hypothetical protein
MLHGQAPIFDHLKVFGCLCYAHNLGKTSDEFSSRSRKCVFVGYPYGKKGWKLFDLDTQRYFVSRDVEKEFPFTHKHKEDHDSSMDSPMMLPVLIESDDESYGHNNTERRENLANDIDTCSDVRGGENHLDNHKSDEPREDLNELNQTLESVDQGNVEELGRGHRIKVPSVKLRDYVTHTIQKLSPSPSSPSSRRISGAPYPLTHYVSCDNFSMKHRRFLAVLSLEREPVHFAEAVQDAKWRLAMQQELQALEDNGTWTLQPLPNGKKPLGCKWVYKIKHNSDGTIERYKARLVILGNHQKEGIDYTETFAPVVKMVTVCLVLAVAAAKQWETHQMDVHKLSFTVIFMKMFT